MVFTHIIPTKLEVDGVVFPPGDEISLWSISKGYGHYHVRLVFFGLIKSKALIIPASKKSIHLKVVLIRHKIPHYTLSILAICLPLLNRVHSNFKIYAFILICPFVYIMESLTNFVEIHVNDSPS